MDRNKKRPLLSGNNSIKRRSRQSQWIPWVLICFLFPLLTNCFGKKKKSSSFTSSNEASSGDDTSTPGEGACKDDGLSLTAKPPVHGDQLLPPKKPVLSVIKRDSGATHLYIDITPQGKGDDQPAYDPDYAQYKVCFVPTTERCPCSAIKSTEKYLEDIKLDTLWDRETYKRCFIDRGADRNSAEVSVTVRSCAEKVRLKESAFRCGPWAEVAVQSVDKQAKGHSSISRILGRISRIQDEIATEVLKVAPAATKAIEYVEGRGRFKTLPEAERFKFPTDGYEQQNTRNLIQIARLVSEQTHNVVELYRTPLFDEYAASMSVEPESSSLSLADNTDETKKPCTPPGKDPFAEIQKALNTGALGGDDPMSAVGGGDDNGNQQQSGGNQNGGGSDPQANEPENNPGESNQSPASPPSELSASGLSLAGHAGSNAPANWGTGAKDDIIQDGEITWKLVERTPDPDPNANDVAKNGGTTDAPAVDSTEEIENATADRVAAKEYTQGERVKFSDALDAEALFIWKKDLKKAKTQEEQPQALKAPTAEGFVVEGEIIWKIIKTKKANRHITTPWSPDTSYYLGEMIHLNDEYKAVFDSTASVFNTQPKLMAVKNMLNNIQGETAAAGSMPEDFNETNQVNLVTGKTVFDNEIIWSMEHCPTVDSSLPAYASRTRYAIDDRVKIGQCSAKVVELRAKSAASGDPFSNAADGDTIVDDQITWLVGTISDKGERSLFLDGSTSYVDYVKKPDGSISERNTKTPAPSPPARQADHFYKLWDTVKVSDTLKAVVHAVSPHVEDVPQKKSGTDAPSWSDKTLGEEVTDNELIWMVISRDGSNNMFEDAWAADTNYAVGAEIKATESTNAKVVCFKESCEERGIGETLGDHVVLGFQSAGWAALGVLLLKETFTVRRTAAQKTLTDLQDVCPKGVCTTDPAQARYNEAKKRAKGILEGWDLGPFSSGKNKYINQIQSKKTAIKNAINDERLKVVEVEVEVGGKKRTTAVVLTESLAEKYNANPSKFNKKNGSIDYETLTKADTNTGTDADNQQRTQAEAEADAEAEAKKAKQLQKLNSSESLVSKDLQKIQARIDDLERLKNDTGLDKLGGNKKTSWLRQKITGGSGLRRRSYIGQFGIGKHRGRKLLMFGGSIASFMMAGMVAEMSNRAHAQQTSKSINLASGTNLTAQPASNPLDHFIDEINRLAPKVGILRSEEKGLRLELMEIEYWVSQYLKSQQ